MSEYVSAAYERQLHQLAEALLEGRELAPPQPAQSDWVEPLFLGAVAVEGCPPDEAYPACDNCQGCGHVRSVQQS